MFRRMRNEIRLRLRKKIASLVFHFRPRWMPSQRLDTISAAVHQAEKIKTLPPEAILSPKLVGLCTEEQYTQHILGDYPNGILEIPERRCYKLTAGRVFIPECLALSQNRIISESLPTQHYLNMASFLASWFQPRKKTNKNRVFLLGMPLVKNYHLWLHYALPRLMFWEKLSDRGEIPVLISKNSPKFVFQSLDYYAALNRDFRFIALSRQELRVEQLFLAEPLGFRDTPHPRAIEWLRHRFLQTSDASSRRALYVTRKGALERDVANEQAILDILEPLGFQIFDPTKHTFVEQVKTFSQARVVVGPHGAAFANMAFAPLGSRLIELIGGSHLLPCFRYLMQMINGNYDALQCDSVEQHLFINAIQQAKLAQYLQKMAK